MDGNVYVAAHKAGRNVGLLVLRHSVNTERNGFIGRLFAYRQSVGMLLLLRVPGSTPLHLLAAASSQPNNRAVLDTS